MTVKHLLSCLITLDVHKSLTFDDLLSMMSLFTLPLKYADSCTRIAAGEAIALIFETGRVYNFCRAEDNYCKDKCLS